MEDIIAVSSLIWFAGSMIVFGVYLALHGKRVIAATDRYCRATEALFAWRLANPDRFVGDSSHARTLVHEAVLACREFGRFHPFLDMEDEIARILSLLDEHGPEPPRKRVPRTSGRKAAFLSRSGRSVMI